jgi:hypothetical protein
LLLLEKNALSLRNIEENIAACWTETRVIRQLQALENNTDWLLWEDFVWVYFTKVFFLRLKNIKRKLMIIDSTTLQLSRKLLQLGNPCRNTHNASGRKFSYLLKMLLLFNKYLK